MLIICHHPPRHITGGVFGLQRGLDYLHKSVCKGCHKTGTITMIPEQGFPLTQNHNNARAAPLMQFLCDGYKPMGRTVRGLWKRERASDGTEFKDLDLSKETYYYPVEDGEPELETANLDFELREVRG